MAKKEKQIEQIELFSGKPATRAVWRENAKIYKDTYKVPFENILPGWNFRQKFEGIKELAEDIFQNGLQDPLKGDMNSDGWFVLTDGERRWRAMKILWERGDLTDVEVLPNPSDMTPVDRIFRMLGSGVHKSAYEPIEIATAIRKLKDDYQLSNKEIATRMGKSRQWVDNMINLEKMPDEVKEEIKAGTLTATTAINGKPKKNRKPEPDADNSDMYGYIDDEPDDDDENSFFPGLGEDVDETATYAPMLQPGDKVVPMGENSEHEEMAGIMLKSPTVFSGPKTERDFAKELQAVSGDLDFDKERSEQEGQVNSIAKNVNWLEGLIDRLKPNNADSKDAMNRLKWIRDDIDALKLFFSKNKNRGI